MSEFQPPAPGPKAQPHCASRGAMGGRYLEASSLEASRCFAMLAGAAYKRPRPALSEINKYIISEWCSSPLALPLSGPTRRGLVQKPTDVLARRTPGLEVQMA